MGRKTSFYLNSSQLLRLQALGDPRLADVLELGLRTMELQDRVNSRAGLHERIEAGPEVQDGDCPHPVARRDQKSGLCNLCGVNVG